ncbi:NAD(P)/FAD-dependent oxidoreductase [Variovorax guangxiensis]|uniref:NAD(P)/FAD-dependent oxidoreductase n=1 Tax=Variovorax guangxiensis TaxID=1775474 RepID=UPI00285F92DF|nr:3-phenylpropionate/trans-cinnamate dioxygenase ferredoxin reductase subunit [Variovorax guangxiensis]
METSGCGFLIVGAGHAGSELALAARQGGLAGRIVLLGEESALPYQRPPLSKDFLCGKADEQALALRPASAYDAAQIELRQGARVERIDRAEKVVTLVDGTRLRYEKLALCTGGRPRPLVCEGMPAQGVASNLFYLRTLADAEAMRQKIQTGTRVVIVGGGYVGLEVAASARSLGAEVTVIEAQPRVLARVAGEAVSRFYESVHCEQGVSILTGVGIASVESEAGRIRAVNCSDGTRLPLDVLVAGIGMLPNTEAARAAGLAEEGGIPVDDLARTADPDIVAAGDCTLQRHPLYGPQMRIESVPNALEQARAAASWLCGKPKPNASVPWFWSDQYDLKLQMAGLSQGYDDCVLRGLPATRSFCAFYLRAGRLIAVDAVNRPGDFMAARRALAQQPPVDAAGLGDESVPLKELLAPAALVTGKP